MTVAGLEPLSPSPVSAVEIAARAGRRHPLLRLVVRRLGMMAVLSLVLSVLVFGGTQVLPGDAAQAVLGRNASPEAVAAFRAQLELDRPIIEQYTSWLSGILRGDGGTSLAAGRPVSDLLGPSVANTLVLALVALAVLVPVSLVLGVVAGVRRGSLIDHVITVFSLAAISVPEFVSGAFLVLVFAVRLGAVPAVSLIAEGSTPLTDPTILVLPVAVLVLAGLGYTVRIIRAGVSDIMQSDYIAAARLNGMPERRVIWRYALPNALAPTVQTLTLSAAWLLGGTVVVETVFGYPGLGQTLVEAVRARDIPTVQAAALLVGVTYIALNIASDVITVLLIPKLRTSL